MPPAARRCNVRSARIPVSQPDIPGPDHIETRTVRTPQATPPARHDPTAATNQPTAGLRVRCPHCHSKIDLAPEASLSQLVCPACGSEFNFLGDATKSHGPRVSDRVGHFELIEWLGEGQFGTVWLARDTELDRHVAVKIPRKGQLDEDEIEQFLREARAAAQLRHPNIVSVHEVGREGSSLFIVSEFVRGATLADWLTAQQPTPREAAELVAKMADALHHAHDSGVIHRDLKPSNIMLDATGEPHVMDFGLARRERGELTVTVDG